MRADDRIEVCGTKSPNEHGVWPADEQLELPNRRAGWHGAPLACIKLVRTLRGWMAAGSFCIEEHGHSSPIVEGRSPLHTSRADAIAHAAAQIRADIVTWRTVTPDGRAVLQWLDELLPDQLDMFPSSGAEAGHD